MKQMTNNREDGITKLREQWDAGGALNAGDIEQLVATRRKHGMSEEDIDKFRADITPDVSRFVFFFSYPPVDNEDGVKRVEVMRIIADSIEEAIEKLDDHGKFIEQGGEGSLPRLHQWR